MIDTTRLKKSVPFQGDGQTKAGLITFEAHLRAFGVYSALYGSGQSAERLAQRGGFGVYELDVFYPEWRNHIVKRD